MLDLNLIFDGTPPTTGVAITATRDSTNVIDLLIARDVGANQPLAVHVDITQVFATLTSLTVDLQTSADNSTYFSLLKSNVYPVAQLIVGAPLFRYDIPVNQELNSSAGVLKIPGRYLKLVYTVAGSNATTGAVFSYITPREDRNQFFVYPNNYTAAVSAGEV